MAEIVNLRAARKQKTRAGREAEAARNRALHGRTKAEKQRDLAAEEKKRTFLEGHFRDRPDSEK
jgi:hypothetical protein